MKVPETITQELARIRRQIRADSSPDNSSHGVDLRCSVDWRRRIFYVPFMPASYQRYSTPRKHHLYYTNVGHWAVEMPLPNHLDAVVGFTSWEWEQGPSELRIVAGPRSGNEE